MNFLEEVKPTIPYTQYKLNKTGKALYQIGKEAISKNKLALVILAGGQATRLGSKSPKGCYILPKINKTLFQLHCHSVKGVNKLFNINTKVIIMTSRFTHDETVDYFKKHKNFGLDIHFVIQSEAICYDFDEEPIKLFDDYAKAPDGNGSIFKVFKDKDVYAFLNNIEYINVISVDNALARLCDPVLLGSLIREDLDCISKCIKKKENENVGVFVKLDNKIVIKEYSEVRNINFIYGNMCHHIFKIDFMKKMGNVDLPVHKASKKIPYTENNILINPKEKNGYKSEFFIFDCFEHTYKNGILVVPRELEFSPVKNSLEEKEDNPETAVDDLFKRSRILLEEAGAEIIKGQVFICTSISVFGENLENYFKKKILDDLNLE
ncbi:UDP-N-acetylglucosamine pyrophosphorylase [Gurleya vavrai]